MQSLHRQKRTAGAVLALLAGISLLPPAAAAVELQPAPPNELLVELAGPEGRALSEIAPETLEVVVGDDVLPVRDLAEIGSPWRVVIYLDLLLTEPVEFRSAAFELAGRAETLTGLGPVEIVVAGADSARVVLPATDNAPAVSEALSWIRLREEAEGAQRILRRRFVEEFDLAEADDTPAAERAERMAELGAGVRRAIEDEAALLERQRLRLLRWLADHDAPGPKLMILASGGFDSDPVAFYRAALGGGKLAGAVSGLESPVVTPSVADLGQVLSVYGWLVMPLAPVGAVDPLARSDPEQERARREAEQVETVSQSGSLDSERTVGTIDAGRLFGRRGKGDEKGGGVRAELLSPRAPLLELARATGGELLTGAAELDSALQRLPQRRRLRFDSYQEAGSPARLVSVRAKSGQPEVRARTRQWIGRATPESVAALRAERFFNSEEGEGELEIAASLRSPEADSSGGLAVELDERLVTGTTTRVSVAVDREDGSVEVRHYLVGGEGVQPEIQEDGPSSVTLPVFFHSEATVAVVAEDLRTGRWGAAFAEEGLSDVVPTADDSLFLPAPKAVHLMAPREAMVMGRTTFETVVSEARVSRVEFLVDGVRVSESNAPPYSATVDLGKLPELHDIEVVAFADDGTELDRDRITVNEGTGSFRVRIADPRTEAQRRGGRPVVGTLDVEVDVRVPRTGRLEKLEFYWQDALVGTRYASPWVHRLRIADGSQPGFLRVLGHLDDGSTSEDVMVFNSPGSSERVDVDLVELYVVVTDRKGRPVRGLTRDQFRVEEEGERQTLANFGDAGDLPITVGLAIDSSASMFVKLPEVQAAAAGYVGGLTTRKDRAFVVGFGSEPRLARDTTNDMGQVLEGLYRLEPDGQTAIWRAVVYSLVQLQGVAGKKALIVYSDGADEDPDFSYKTALRFAQRVGVPLYFIVANDEIYRTGGKSLNIRSFLGRLENISKQVGGRVFLTKVNDDLSQIYEEIDLELRSQYVLGYYPSEPADGGWRRVEVRVDEPGVEPRTVAGYYR